MKLSLDDAKKLYKKAQYAYFHTGKDLMTDSEFDRLEGFIAKSDPKFVRGTGILGKKRDVKLARFMPSLDKFKVGMTNFEKFRDLVTRYSDSASVMDKLDGASVLASYKNGSLISLATRGDGETGKDITFLARYCRNLPTDDVGTFTGNVRMEAALTRHDYASFYSKKADSARAAVSGALNRQEESRILRHIHFIALRQLDSVTTSDGLRHLQKLGFETVRRELLDVSSIGENMLTKLLAKRRKTSEYEMDGLVIHADCTSLSKDASKPKFAFAFKLDTTADDAPLTTIREIEWKISAFGIAVPKAIVDPVKFDGVTVRRVALRNYEWAASRGCGVGARVRVVRNGDIIPGIARVDKKMPLAKPTHLGKLTFNGTDLVAESGVSIREVLKRFFKHCGLDGFGPRAAGELATNGRNTLDVVNLTDAEDWREYVGGSKALAERAALEINKFRRELTTEKLPAVMSACGAFGKGVGRTRIQSFIDVYGVKMLLNKTSVPEIRAFAKAAEGCGDVFGDALAAGMPEWYRWLKASGLKFKEASKAKASGSKMKGQAVSWTGYRDESEESWVESQGGQVVKFGGKTTVLLHRKGGKESGKVDKAIAKGIRVTTFDKLRG